MSVRVCLHGHEQTEVNICRNEQGENKGCRICAREKTKAWYYKNKARALRSHKQSYETHKQRCYEKNIARQLRVWYGLTPVERDNMLVAQDHRCANTSCGRAVNKSSHIDHNHATGKVRGILCKQCNLSLGLLHESVSRIRGLAQYIEIAEQ